ncbi:hypothetical protein H9L39_07036 [Fusarium oxysporum f. sp. albedinis]|nr:hypothetical protein H9L39_07036 [Fusarium oxysporum f. sp. albedinis]
MLFTSNWHGTVGTVFQRRLNRVIPYLQVPALKAATSPITGRLSDLSSPHFAAIYRHKPYAVRGSAPSAGVTKSGSRSLSTLGVSPCAEIYVRSISYRYCAQPALTEFHG